MISRMEKFYFSKWLTYSAACLVMSSAGLAYTFSVYSDSIKDRFGYTQTRLAGCGKQKYHTLHQIYDGAHTLGVS